MLTHKFFFFFANPLFLITRTLILIIHKIWAFLLQYVEIAEKELKMDMIEVLNFFFQLGCLTLGRVFHLRYISISHNYLNIQS